MSEEGARLDRGFSRAPYSLGGAAMIVGAATLGSKLLGFARDAVLSARFGAGTNSDAYITASLLPITLFAAVGVSLTTVFIPLFSELVTRGDRARAEEFAANVNGVATLVVAALVLLLELLAGPLLRVLEPHWVERRAIAVVLVRIMAPLIIFYAWSAVVGGVLNVRGFFGPNAAMGIPQNVVIIASMFVATIGANRDISLVAWGSLVGTFTTYLIQLPALRRSRFRVGWRLDFRDPLLARMGRMALPAVATAMAQQLGTLASLFLGSRLPHGLITTFVLAGRLQLLAYSILGMSISTVLYPSMARAVGRGDMGRFLQTFNRGLRLVNFVTLPVTVGLLLLRGPVVHVAYEHGQFTAQDALDTIYPLIFLTLGTPLFAWLDYLNRAFFALQDTRSPMIGAVLAVCSTILLDVLLVGPLRQGGLAIGSAAGWVTGATFLALRLRGRMGLLGGRQVVSSGVRVLAASIAGFLPAAWLAGPLAARLGPEHWLTWVATLGVVGVLAATIYVGACWLFRVPELRGIAELVLARLRGRAGAEPA